MLIAAFLAAVVGAVAYLGAGLEIVPEDNALVAGA